MHLYAENGEMLVFSCDVRVVLHSCDVFKGQFSTQCSFQVSKVMENTWYIGIECQHCEWSIADHRFLFPLSSLQLESDPHLPTLFVLPRRMWCWSCVPIQCLSNAYPMPMPVLVLVLVQELRAYPMPMPGAWGEQAAWCPIPSLRHATRKTLARSKWPKPSGSLGFCRPCIP